MTTLAKEVVNVQNPALGAVLIWRFTCGYVAGQRNKRKSVTPHRICRSANSASQGTMDFVHSTRLASGLRAFAAKFGDSAQSKQICYFRSTSGCFVFDISPWPR